MGYEGAKGNELGWKHHRPDFFSSLLEWEYTHLPENDLRVLV
jgi:hypothetical protein